MSAGYPRHTTLSDEEKEAVGTAPKLTQHQCCVTYPDGATGPCHYENFGRTYHRLTYRYGENEQRLACVTLYEAVQGTMTAIEAVANANAEKAFDQAVETERKDFFARVCYPAGGARRVDPNKATLKPDKAKRLAGRYAVCLRLPSNRLLAISRDYETIAEANNRFLADPRDNYVVACCSRLDRRWMVPNLNPLHKVRDFRKEVGNA